MTAEHVDSDGLDNVVDLARERRRRATKRWRCGYLNGKIEPESMAVINEHEKGQRFVALIPPRARYEGINFTADEAERLARQLCKLAAEARQK